MGPIEPVGYIVMDGGQDLCAHCATLEWPELDSEFSRVNEKAIHDGSILPQYHFDYEDRDYEVFCESCGVYIGGHNNDDDVYDYVSSDNDVYDHDDNYDAQDNE